MNATPARLHARLAAGETVTVAFFGGSITEGYDASDPETTSWRALVTAWLRARYPAATLRAINASIGGTGSDLGAFRLARDVLAHAPDLVLVEFAVNDHDRAPELTRRGFEGLLRHLRRAAPACAVVVVFTGSKAMEPSWDAGEEPVSVALHRALAAHYGVPCIDLATAWREALAAGRTTWEQLAPDGCHPRDPGFALYAAAAQSGLAALLDAPAAANNAPPPAESLPPPLHPRPWETARLIDASAAHAPGWTLESVSLAGRHPQRLVCTDPDAELALDFHGDTLGVFWLVAPDSGAVRWSIDASPWKQASSWDEFARYFTRAHYQFFATDLADGPHRLRLRVAAETPAGSTGRVVRIGAFLVNG